MLLRKIQEPLSYIKKIILSFGKFNIACFPAFVLTMKNGVLWYGRNQMKIVTTEMFSNKDIVEVKEAVFSEQVLSVNVVKDAISGIKGIFGGKSNSYSEEFSKGRELALVALKSQAALLSANIIIDVCVDYNQFVNSDIVLIVVTARGTAAVIE